MRPHRRRPTRLPQPWDSPGKNTGVGCHFLLQCMKVKSESEVAQPCPTLSDPMDCSPPGSSVHGIFQARVLEWGGIAFSCNCIVIHQFNYCYGEKTPFNETWRQSTNPTKGTHAVDHSTAMTRASGRTGEGRWMGKLQPPGRGRGLDWGQLSRQQDETGNQNQWGKQTNHQRTPTTRKTYTELFFYKYSERNQERNHREMVK